MRRDLPQVPTYTPTLARTSVPRYFTISPSLAVDEQSPLPAEADLATPPPDAVPAPLFLPSSMFTLFIGPFSAE